MRDNEYAGLVIQRLLSGSQYNFTDSGQYLTKGICPQCGQKTLFTSKDKPWVLRCNRRNKCGYEEPTRQALPDLFEDLAKRFPATPKNPLATAEAYLGINRGFNLSLIRGWYSQGTYTIPHTDRYIPTVRFYLDSQKTRYWERLIGQGEDGKKAHFGGKRKESNLLYRGDAWSPPEQVLEKGDYCFLTEGILHAIALAHAGVKAAAIFSCDHYPETFFKQHEKKGIRWVWALDSDFAGTKAMRKHHERHKAGGELSTICLLPTGLDWDDAFRAGKLTDAFIADGKYRGRLFLAKDVTEKAYHLYRKKPRQKFILDFENALYSITVSSSLNEKLEPLVEEYRQEVFERAQKNKEAKQPPTHEQIYESAQAAALETQEGEELFRAAVSITQISNVNPRFLYISQNDILDEQRYVFSIDYANGQGQDIIELEGTSITSPDAFHKALLNRSRGGTFDGDARNLKRLRSFWLDSRVLTVSAVPYIGYEKSLGAYIFQRHAWFKGRRMEVNPQGYFMVGRQGIKSSLKGLSINTEGQFSPDWIGKFETAFSWQGLATLAFWLGSLFVQQIRDKQKSFPFLELTGEPGAGKSTILEFLWKCVGRDDYEGFDLLKSTVAGRRRAFSQVSNLPVVIIESDRETGDRDAKQKQFGFDEVKPFWNGRGTGTLGVAKRGNETDESLFQGSLLISQNAEVDGSEALLQRIVHCHADKRHHKAGTREEARFFERQTSETVGGFLHQALSREQDFLTHYFQGFESHEKQYTEAGLVNERIIKNHAQIAACASCLPLIFPSMSRDTVDAIALYLQTRAFLREIRIAADHPLIDAFWEAYEYINAAEARQQPEVLNHSNAPETTIALNINHYCAKCREHGQAYPDMSMLKKLLPGNRRHKFVETKPIRSRITQTIIRCWVFTKGEKK